MFTRQTCFD